MHAATMRRIDVKDGEFISGVVSRRGHAAEAAELIDAAERRISAEERSKLGFSRSLSFGPRTRPAVRTCRPRTPRRRQPGRFRGSRRISSSRGDPPDGGGEPSRPAAPLGGAA